MMHFHVEGHFHQLPTSSDGYVLTNTEPLATDLSGNIYTSICTNTLNHTDIYVAYSYSRGGSSPNCDNCIMMVHVDP